VRAAAAAGARYCSGPRDLWHRGDFVEIKLHGFGVKSGAGAALGTDRTEQIGRLRALIVDRAGTRASPGAAIGELVLLADPHLVLEPNLYRCARGELGADFRHAVSKLFLKASMASGSCLYAFGRALTCEKPKPFKAR
jgi:hypothetical protein